MRKVLVVGNMGYIGPVLVEFFKQNNDSVIVDGFDLGLFGHCLFNADILPEVNLDIQQMVQLLPTFQLLRIEILNKEKNGKK